MKFKTVVVTLLLTVSGVSAGTVFMQNTGHQLSPGPNAEGFYLFTINGMSNWRLLCDEFTPNVMTDQYTAIVNTLADLSLTTLALNGGGLTNAQILQRYQWIAILDSLAYGNTANIAFASPFLNSIGYTDPANSLQFAADVTWANRRIVDGHGPLPGKAQNLYDWVQLQNPTNYNLKGFKVYTSDPFYRTQEMTGYDPVAEPATLGLLSGGLFLIGVHQLIRRKDLKRAALAEPKTTGLTAAI